MLLLIPPYFSKPIKKWYFSKEVSNYRWVPWGCKLRVRGERKAPLIIYLAGASDVKAQFHDLCCKYRLPLKSMCWQNTNHYTTGVFKRHYLSGLVCKWVYLSEWTQNSLEWERWLFHSFERHAFHLLVLQKQTTLLQCSVYHLSPSPLVSAVTKRCDHIHLCTHTGLLTSNMSKQFVIPIVCHFLICNHKWQMHLVWFSLGHFNK